MENRTQSLLQQSNKILIIPQQKLSLDLLFAASALNKSLQKRGKNSKIFLGPTLNKTGILAKTELDSSDIKTSDDVGIYKLVLNHTGEKIKDLQWIEKDGELQIVIQGVSMPIRQEDIKVSQDQEDFDLLVLIGNVGIEFLKLSRINVDPLKTLVLSQKLGQDWQASPWIQSKEQTASEAIMSFIKGHNLSFVTDVSNLLLSGIYWATNQFTSRTTIATFLRASELLQKGAKINKVFKSAIQTLSLNQSLQLAEIFKNVQVAGDGIYFSILNSNLPKNNDPDFSNQAVPLVQIIGCKVGFIIKSETEQSTINIEAVDDTIDLTEIWNKYDGVGNKRSGMFETKLPVETIKTELIAILKSKLTVNDNHAENGKVGFLNKPNPTIPDGNNSLQLDNFDNRGENEQTNFVDPLTPAIN